MTAHVKDAAASLLMVWNTLQAKLQTAVKPDELLMSPEEVSAYTGVSVQALAMLRYRHKGPKCLRPSQRVVRYRKRDVDAWIDAGEIDVVTADDERLQDTAHVTIVPDGAKG